MKSLTGVILAAGAGSRLGDLGKQYSKPTVPVAGRALIDWVIDSLRGAGIGRIIVVGHPLDTRLAAVLAQRDPVIELVLQQERRGIAAAIACALPALRSDETFLACACDSLYPQEDLDELVKRARNAPAAAHVAVLDMGQAATASRSAVLVSANRVERIVEKPSPGSVDSGLVALPLYVLPVAARPLLAEQDAGESYVTTALSRFIDRGGDVQAFHMRQRWELTVAEDVEPLEILLRKG